MRRDITLGLLFLLVVQNHIFCDEHTISPTVEVRSHFALLDEVRLLATGLLQLGQSLREFVQKTKGQINDIVNKLNIFDRSFYQLSALASEIKEEEEELKKTTVVLKASNEEIKDLSVQIYSKVDTILQEKSRLQHKVEGLEERLSSMSQGLVTSEQVEEITALRKTIYSQEQSIAELLKAVKEQSHQLNQQRSKIKILEDKVAANVHQATTEKNFSMSNSEVLSLPPYRFSEKTGSKLMSLPADCSELFNQGERVSGVYVINPGTSEPFMAFCDMTTGETVIQRRTDGSINFDQNWEKYESGFGDLQGEFWLGLSRIHSLSVQGNSVLHIHLEECKQLRRVFEYRFALEGPQSNYTIHLSPLSHDLPDVMGNQTNTTFSTKDRDNGKQHHHNCIQDTGGWWFHPCGGTNLNGKYFKSRRRPGQKRGIQWRAGRRGSSSLKFTQMSVGRLQLSPHL
ncbi:angiopoietin-related protein 3-like [Periophthalmus magnuspinnatus]|uniref:angiopoietin-related protein 3-like n=1 Tax=Periophthalmus magnuspinnatus TaxID=409849 RepID=UPI00145AF301|nr:angiopoietin-related protein 3-like [Periophthalmus magnuspinnatus]